MKQNGIVELLKRSSKKGSFAFALLSLFILYSCDQNGSDGRPGMAFLSVNWDVSKPTYLDVGTSDIPAVFEWGTYYRTYPSTNNLRYEGQLWKGSYWENYGWDVNYVIYENPGEYGRPNYNGRDGLNSYFDIVCSPYGPDISNYDAQIKPHAPNAGIDVNATPKTITVVKTNGNYSIKLTYKRINPVHNFKELRNADGRFRITD